MAMGAGFCGLSLAGLAGVGYELNQSLHEASAIQDAVRDSPAKAQHEQQHTLDGWLALGAATLSAGAAGAGAYSMRGGYTRFMRLDGTWYGETAQPPPLPPQYPNHSACASM
jgi:hypothetical protein